MAKNSELIKFSNNNLDNDLSSLKSSSEELVWLENLSSEHTAETYKTSLSIFCKFFNIKSAQDLKQVEAMHIIAFRKALKDAKMKNSTINTRLSSLSSLFKHLIEKQEIKVNPVYGVTRMKKQSHKVESRALETHEVEAMLRQPDTDSLKGLRDKAILSILFNAGTRVGTLAALKGKDIYEENGYLIIDMHLKGDKRNKVAVNSCIGANLKNYFNALGYCVQTTEGKIKFNIADEAPVFPSMSNNSILYRKKEESITTRAIGQLWHKYADKAGVEKTNPHCARSTFITNALKSGCDLQHVQHTAGHSDPRTTKSYDHGKVEYKNSASLRVSFG